jgi:hypothetical protein
MKYIFVITLLAFSFLSHAQEVARGNNVLWIIKSKINKPDIKTEHLIINGDQIEKMEVVDAKKIKDQIGDIKQNIVIIATLKSDVTIVKLLDFYASRKINYSVFPTVVDGKGLTNLSDVFIDEKSLQGITVGLDSIRILTSNYYNQLQQKANKGN